MEIFTVVVVIAILSLSLLGMIFLGYKTLKLFKDQYFLLCGLIGLMTLTAGIPFFGMVYLVFKQISRLT